MVQHFVDATAENDCTATFMGQQTQLFTLTN